MWEGFEEKAEELKEEEPREEEKEEEKEDQPPKIQAVNKRKPARLDPNEDSQVVLSPSRSVAESQEGEGKEEVGQTQEDAEEEEEGTGEEEAEQEEDVVVEIEEGKTEEGKTEEGKTEETKTEETKEEHTGTKPEHPEVRNGGACEGNGDGNAKKEEAAEYSDKEEKLSKRKVEVEDSDQEEGAQTFRDRKPLTVEPQLTPEVEGKCKEVLSSVQRANCMEEDLVEPQRRLKKTLKEAEVDAEDPDRQVREQEEMEEELAKAKSRGRGRGRGRGAGKAKAKAKGKAAKDQEKEDQEKQAGSVEKEQVEQAPEKATIRAGRKRASKTAKAGDERKKEEEREVDDECEEVEKDAEKAQEVEKLQKEAEKKRQSRSSKRKEQSSPIMKLARSASKRRALEKSAEKRKEPGEVDPVVRKLNFEDADEEGEKKVEEGKKKAKRQRYEKTDFEPLTCLVKLCASMLMCMHMVHTNFRG